MRRVPSRPHVRAATVDDVDAADARLLRVVDAAYAVGAAKAGDWLVCRAGCDACCHGPFPITRLDARRLAAGLAELTRTDPERAAAVRKRAVAAVECMTPGYPGDPSTGRPSGDPDVLDAFFAGHADLACPALDPDAGTCELYDARPVACRTYGPPQRFGDEAAPHCKLCFDGASDDVVERCRIEPDPDDLEGTILAALGVPGDAPWHTLIAFVLTGAAPAD